MEFRQISVGGLTEDGGLEVAARRLQLQFVVGAGHDLCADVTRLLIFPYAGHKPV